MIEVMKILWAYKMLTLVWGCNIVQLGYLIYAKWQIGNRIMPGGLGHPKGRIIN